MVRFLIPISLVLTSCSFLSEKPICKIHDNGGGKVCGLAKVDKGIFIDKNSMISGNILITGNVHIQNSKINGTDKTQEASGVWGNVEIKNSTLKGFYKISGNTKILGDSKKSDIQIIGDKKISLYGNALIDGNNIFIKGQHTINGNSKIYSGTSLYGETSIFQNPQIKNTLIKGKATISGNSLLEGKCVQEKNCIKIEGDGLGVRVYGNVIIKDEVELLNESIFAGKSQAYGNSLFKDKVQVYGGSFRDNVVLKDQVHVWGNNTNLSKDVILSGFYGAFNLNKDKGHYHTNEPKLGLDNFRPVNSKFISKLEQLLEGINIDEKAIDIKLSQKKKNINSISKNEAINYLKHITKLFGNRLDNTADGCFLRAHITSIEAEKLEIDTAKIVILTPHTLADKKFDALKEKSNLLRFKSKDVDHKWISHYSNLIYIKSNNGKRIPYVIDPAVKPYPMSVREWVKLVTYNKEDNKEIFVNFRVLPKEIGTFYTYSNNVSEYQQVYGRLAKTNHLLNLLDEINDETTKLEDNFKL